MDKPSDMQAYRRWLSEEHLVDWTRHTRRYYESVVGRATKELATSPTWQALVDRLPELGEKFLVSTGYGLYSATGPIRLVTKPYASFLLKTYRKNILDNQLWPQAPTTGWVLPGNWFESINDLVRAQVIVKYLDGARFLGEQLLEHAKETGLAHTLDFEAREYGYYAVHFYSRHAIEIPKVDWDTQMVTLSVELQITTQLKDVIGRLTHLYYEDRRTRLDQPELKWQWDYKSDEFLANYLGHVLHYLDGMIIEARERQGRAKS